MERTVNNSTIATLTSAIFILLAVRHANNTFVYISILPAILSIIYFIIGIVQYCKSSNEIRLDNRNRVVFQCCMLCLVIIMYVGYLMV